MAVGWSVSGIYNIAVALEDKIDFAAYP